MNPTANQPLNATCTQCRRQGFTWARGTCQYCGHKQFEDSIFSDERVLRDGLNEEAIENYKKVKTQPERAFVGGDAGIGDFSGLDCGCD